jgi:hypothetical protein
MSATVPRLVLGSSWARLTRADSAETFVRGPRFVVCDATGKGYCRGMRPAGVEMNTFPHIKLELDLPRRFSIQGELWSTLHEHVDWTLQQTIVGPTLRRTNGVSWAEIGIGMASNAKDRSAGFGQGMAHSCGTGELEPALLAGVGTGLNVGGHVLFDVRLSGGVDVGDTRTDVYHANLVVAFKWQ